MKEAEYIAVRQVTRLRDVLTILREVITDDDDAIEVVWGVPNSEHEDVMHKLYSWERRLQEMSRCD